MMSSVIRSLTPKLLPVAAPALATASAAFGTSHSHHHVAPTAAEIAAARKEDIILANNGGSYERPYVSASWLHAHLGRVHLLDVSWRLVHTPPTPHDNYVAGHIPTARYVDIDAIADTTNPKPHALASPDFFASKMEELGIAANDTVVIYDDTNMAPSARFWWTCDFFGLLHVRILEGGLAAWNAAGYPTVTGKGKADALELADAGIVLPPVSASAAAAHGHGHGHADADSARAAKATVSKGNGVEGRRFDLSAMRSRENNVVDLAWVKEFVKGEHAEDMVLDARSAGRFQGTEPEPRAHLPSGHFPNASNLPFTDFLNNDPISGAAYLRPKREIEHILRKHNIHFGGVKANGRVVLSCGSGLTACTLHMGLHLLGKKNLALYDGSWTEYVTAAAAEPDALPIAKGPGAEAKKQH